MLPETEDFLPLQGGGQPWDSSLSPGGDAGAETRVVGPEVSVPRERVLSAGSLPLSGRSGLQGAAAGPGAGASGRVSRTPAPWGLAALPTDTARPTWAAAGGWPGPRQGLLESAGVSQAWPRTPHAVSSGPTGPPAAFVEATPLPRCLLPGSPRGTTGRCLLPGLRQGAEASEAAFSSVCPAPAWSHPPGGCPSGPCRTHARR